MKLGHVAAAAALLTPIALVGSADPAAALSVHTVRASGFMRAIDGGGIFESRTSADRNFSRSVTLTHTAPRRTTTVPSICARETRGELRITFGLTPADTVRVTTQLRLFEGSSCTSSDLEETKTSTSLVGPGASRLVQFGAYTHEVGSYDWAFVRYTVRHSAR
jgi:hypothetical protein